MNDVQQIPEPATTRLAQNIVSQPRIANDRPYIIFLKGAPVYNHNYQIAHSAKILSSAFDGELWFGAPFSVDQTIGSFRLRGVEMQRYGWLQQMRILLPRIINDLNERREQLAGRLIYVNAYDPLTQGVLGTILAHRLKARLLVDLSGDYANRSNYLDGYNSLITRTLLRWRNIAVSQATMLRADAVRQLFPSQAKTLGRLPKSAIVEDYFDWVPSELFERQRKQKENLVLFVGTPFHLKGVDILLDAWERVISRHTTWRLKLIGHGLNRYTDIAWLTAHSAEVSQSRSTSAVAQLMNAASIFALPSRSEAMGRVLIEAAASGATRIGSRTGGIPKMIQHGVDGLLFEKGNVADLAAALDRLMSDELLRKNLADAAIARVRTDFSGERYVADLQRCIACIENKFAPSA